ncbi:hypothetical protein HL666_32180 [Bradyrhizobium sp. 83002]|uniref:hypothetical protein n=1 Tax=Bradyrhizobium aeschynomenes TaxID=2734909 RepID=UPI001553ED17|nr:hypothetical protein [Bradyrhizobium aeschynomenes]NPU15433.1 hypothetical protein [Bradyrhizobium aeschynomenes]
MRYLTGIAIASFATLLAAAPAGGEGEPITDAMRPVMAATRIFALENHLLGDIAIADENEGRIGQRFEVNHAIAADGKLDPCTFTMRRRGGPIIEQISFDRLSAKRKVWPLDGDARIRLLAQGKSGARCELDGSFKKCSTDLELLLQPLGSPSEFDLAVRTLDFIAKVCPPAQLPLELETGAPG